MDSVKKVFVITGASNGIGLETARQLAGMNNKVLMVTRTLEKGEMARANILGTHPEADLEVYSAEMSLQKDIRSVASQILDRHSRIDVLINNVGTWMSEYVLTEEGIETVFATNHLSYFLMTHLLYPALRNAGQGRIVNISSKAHSYGRINLEDPGYSKKYHGLKSNGQSKLANLYFTFELESRKPDPTISTYAVSPGLVKTDIGLKHTSWLHAVAWKFRRRKGQSPAEGAGTTIFCATDPEVQLISGKYWHYKALKEVFPSAQQPELGKELWELSMKMTGIEDYFHQHR
ncbi:MAG TPA: SDR family NAD(P)-dependent oxidoreductase [Saprospiraceae bacterium]|nr:SDR family NAD(P)-dependent oxidoreductase [Saprospiraceae bacterium]